MKNSLLILSLLIAVASCAEPIARKPVIRKTSTFLKESIERNRVINKMEETAFTELMEKDSINSYLSSENGFWYFYILRDTIATRLPVKGDEVTYTYEIRDINQRLLYSQEDLGTRKYLVDQQELISGLQDGIKLMKEGETVTFLFPSHKAYGYSGYDKINSGQPLIYTVKLQKIK